LRGRALRRGRRAAGRRVGQVPPALVKTPVAAPSWKLTATFFAADRAGVKLAIAHSWPAA
jgi:hypothetical protein